MKSGFTLIEILISMAIASMISVMLFMSFGQIGSYVHVVDDYVDVSVKAAIVHQQLEKDLMGVFIPIAAEDQKKTSTQSSPVPPAGSKPAAPVPGAAEKEKPIKKVTKVFFGNNREKNLDTLTFITDDPLQIYWSENKSGNKAGKAKPRIARVIYRLVQDKKEKNTYKLMRQEGVDLYFDTYKPGSTKDIKEYEIIDGIKRMTIEYFVAVPAKDDGASPKEKQKKEYKKTKEWNTEKDKDGAQDDKKDKKKNEKAFPDYVVIQLTLWDNAKKRDTVFAFTISFLADGKQPPEPEPPMTMVQKVLQGVQGAHAAAQPGASAAAAPAGTTPSAPVVAAPNIGSVSGSIDVVHAPIVITEGMSFSSIDQLHAIINGNAQ
ncbi:MAG: prepilin-type N-terminal cleavage/methylation domain-containing protein [Candidatus Dependentiae bacterium]|nr:prepilin-type N-terminal cleavage/methylation domain-containing protein [Candidatus Dependentiae bacterium]